MHLTDTGVLSLECPKNQHLEISVIVSFASGLHIRLISDPELFTDRSRAQRWLFFFFLLLVIKKWISLHSCLSGWMQQQESPSVTCSLSCDVDGQLELEQKCTSLHIQNREGGGNRERTRVSAQCGERVTWIQTHRHTHTFGACSLASG